MGIVIPTIDVIETSGIPGPCQHHRCFCTSKFCRWKVTWTTGPRHQPRKTILGLSCTRSNSYPVGLRMIDLSSSAVYAWHVMGLFRLGPIHVFETAGVSRLW